MASIATGNEENFGELRGPYRINPFLSSPWASSVLPTLVAYIRIPNKSPAFDPDWVKHGHMEKAVALFER